MFRFLQGWQVVWMWCGILFPFGKSKEVGIELPSFLPQPLFFFSDGSAPIFLGPIILANLKVGPNYAYSHVIMCINIIFEQIMNQMLC